MEENKIYDSLENDELKDNQAESDNENKEKNDSLETDNSNQETSIPYLPLDDNNTPENKDTNEISSNVEDDFDFAEALEVYNILTIDDDKWIQRIFTQYLSTWGFTNISAYDPFSGLTEAIKNKPLMIFLDIHLPEVSGELLIKFLKRVEFTKNIPIIIISGNLNKDIIRSTYLAGAAGFITKPFNQETLFAKIKEVLNPAIMNRLIKDGKINTAMIKKKVHLGV